MFWSKIKTASIVLLSVGLVTGCAVVYAFQLGGNAPPNALKEPANPPTKPAPKSTLGVVKPRPDDMPQVITSPYLAVARGADGNHIWCLSLEHEGTWQQYQIPTGTRVAPIMGPEEMALAIMGETIHEVAAFSSKTGRWSVQKLREPAKDMLFPNLGPQLVYYRTDHDIYAFNAAAGTWDSLQLQGTETPRVNYAGGTEAVLVVQQGKMLYIFKHGHWTKGLDIQPWNNGSESDKEFGRKFREAMKN
jgi:hypothetical protein